MDEMDEMLRSLVANLMLSEASEMLTHYVARGGRLHSLADCKRTRKAGGPKNCVIHKPSLHKLTGSPQILRSSALIEDQCEHGVGHPNPDSVAYLNWANGQTWYGIHGCDGCCGPIPEEQKRSRFETALPTEHDAGWPPQDGGY